MTRGEQERSLLGRLGSWAGLLSAGLSAAALGLGVTTPPRSGPYCRESCLGYPYLDAAAFVPRDYLCARSPRRTLRIDPEMAPFRRPSDPGPRDVRP
jgi:hypothetical protein